MRHLKALAAAIIGVMWFTVALLLWVLVFIFMSWVVQDVLYAAEPPLHLYTKDGKPLAEWALPDFTEVWHTNDKLSPEWAKKDLPLTAHYRSLSGWVYQPITGTPRQFRAEYRKSLGIQGKPGQRTLVWVHAEGCGPCDRMLKSLPEVEQLIPVERVEWDWETPGEFSIKSVPLTILVDADNHEIRRWTGYANLQTLKTLIKE